MTGLLFWVLYAAWIGLFVWLGWQQRARILFISSGSLLLAFGVFWFWAMQSAGEPGWDMGGGFAAGMMLLFAIILLVAPALLGLVAFALSKLVARI